MKNLGYFQSLPVAWTVEMPTNHLPCKIVKCPFFLCLFSVLPCTHTATFDALADFVIQYNDFNFKAVILVADNYSLEDCMVENFCSQVLFSVVDTQKFPDVLLDFTPTTNISQMVTATIDTKTLYIFVGSRSRDNFVSVISQVHPAHLAECMWLLVSEDTKVTITSLQQESNIRLDSQVYILNTSLAQLTEIYRVWWDRYVKLLKRIYIEYF